MGRFSIYEPIDSEYATTNDVKEDKVQSVDKRMVILDLIF